MSIVPYHCNKTFVIVIVKFSNTEIKAIYLNNKYYWPIVFVIY